MNKLKLLSIFTLVSLALLSVQAKDEFSISKVSSEQPRDSVYLEGSKDIALILAHGQGKTPTWKVVDPLRKSINQKMDFHTLSLQMPNNRSNYEEYAHDFPEVYDIIKQAISFLQNKKQVKTIYLMGHSMGSRMVSSFVAQYETTPVKGLIIVGCRNNGGYPLSCINNVKDINISILDIWGGDDFKDKDAASERKSLLSDKYIQVEISGANHRLDGHDDELSTTVEKWLKNN